MTAISFAMPHVTDRVSITNLTVPLPQRLRNHLFREDIGERQIAVLKELQGADGSHVLGAVTRIP